MQIYAHTHICISHLHIYLFLLIVTHIENCLHFNNYNYITTENFILFSPFLSLSLGLPRWFSGKESTCQCRRHGFNPGSGRFPEGGNGNPLHYSCLGNFMDRGAWWATVHGIARESDTS